MPHTDIVKARAIRRSGHACEVCGTAVSFKSARFLEVRPLLGMLAEEAESCCVLCESCYSDVQRDQERLAEDESLLEEGFLAQDEAEPEGEVTQGPWGERAAEGPLGGGRPAAERPGSGPSRIEPPDGPPPGDDLWDGPLGEMRRREGRLGGPLTRSEERRLDEEEIEEQARLRELPSREDVLRAARESWFTDDDPDGGLCA